MADKGPDWQHLVRRRAIFDPIVQRAMVQVELRFMSLEDALAEAVLMLSKRLEHTQKELVRALQEGYDVSTEFNDGYPERLDTSGGEGDSRNG